MADRKPGGLWGFIRWAVGGTFLGVSGNAVYGWIGTGSVTGAITATAALLHTTGPQLVVFAVACALVSAFTIRAAMDSSHRIGLAAGQLKQMRASEDAARSEPHTPLPTLATVSVQTVAPTPSLATAILGRAPKDVLEVPYERLAADLKNKTTVQIKALLELYRGQAMIVSGPIENVNVDDYPDRHRATVHLFMTPSALISAMFKEAWVARLRVLHKGDMVSIRGLIYDANYGGFTLGECELVMIPPRDARNGDKSPPEGTSR